MWVETSDSSHTHQEHMQLCIHSSTTARFVVDTTGVTCSYGIVCKENTREVLCLTDSKRGGVCGRPLRALGATLRRITRLGGCSSGSGSGGGSVRAAHISSAGWEVRLTRGGSVHILRVPRSPIHLIVDGHSHTIADDGGRLLRAPACTAAVPWPAPPANRVTIADFSAAVDPSTGGFHMRTNHVSTIEVLGRTYRVQGGQLVGAEEEQEGRGLVRDGSPRPPPPPRPPASRTFLPFPEEEEDEEDEEEGDEEVAEPGSAVASGHRRRRRRCRPLQAIVVSGNADVDIISWPTLVDSKVTLTASDAASLNVLTGAGTLTAAALCITASGESDVHLPASTIAGRLLVNASDASDVCVSASRADVGAASVSIAASGSSDVQLDLSGARAPDEVAVRSSGAASVSVCPKADASTAVGRLKIEASGSSDVSARLSADTVMVSASGSSDVSGFRATRRAVCSAAGTSSVKGRRADACKAERRTSGAGTISLR